MKKGLLNVSIFLIVLIAAFSMFLTDNGDTSSISNNTSQGIILTSTSRVKKRAQLRFKLPASNPAAIVEKGLGDAIEFSDATIDTTLALAPIPKDVDFSVQPYLQLQWAGEATGDARFEVTYLWIAPDETTDTTSGTTVTNNYTASTTVKGLVETNIQLAGLEASDDYIKAKIVRRADHTADTVNSATVNIFDAFIYYTSNKLGESL